MTALLESLALQDPVWILVAVIGFQLVLIALVGAAGSGSSERDSADAYLSSGHDQATRTDNEANAGFSVASGLLGLYDLRFTIRLTQAVNHHYRTRLFERIQALPLTTFDDQRIGDAVFRVLYDTPAITSAVYRILFTPAAAGALALAVVATLRSLYGDHPLLWQAGAMLLAIALRDRPALRRCDAAAQPRRARRGRRRHQLPRGGPRQRARGAGPRRASRTRAAASTAPAGARSGATGRWCCSGCSSFSPRWCRRSGSARACSATSRAW